MLAQAVRHMSDCGDNHGIAVGRLWQLLVWHAQQDTIRLERDLDDFLALISDHGYEFLFLNKTLPGPPDPRSLVPILLFARDRSIRPTVAHNILTQLGLAELERHPGYQLRVQTLGDFRVWLGEQEVKWSRQAGKELFQLLLTERARSLHREEIMGILWPEATAAEQASHFKTAYAALCKDLEPNRQRNVPSAYIVRDGSRYGLRATADIWLDSVEFDTLIDTADDKPAPRYQRALKLYLGDYLADAPYADWLMQERRRLHIRYVHTAERLAQLQQDQADWIGVIETGEAIVRIDPCWEPAYRFLMTAHARQGNHAEVARTYERCAATLLAELDLAPSDVTLTLKQSLLRPATINPALGRF